MTLLLKGLSTPDRLRALERHRSCELARVWSLFCDGKTTPSHVMLRFHKLKQVRTIIRQRRY